MKKFDHHIVGLSVSLVVKELTYATRSFTRGKERVPSTEDGVVWEVFCVVISDDRKKNDTLATS